MQTQYRATLPRTIAAIERGIQEGLHIGAQLYVSRHGQVVADVAFGEAGGGVLMRIAALLLWHPAGSPIAAVVVVLMAVRAGVDWHVDGAGRIPVFAAGGKE